MSDVASMNVAEPFVLFQIASTTYAIRSRDVQQMEMIEHVTPVPSTPPYVEGVVFLRGQVIPVLNLRLKFGLPKVPYNLQTRLLVVRHKDRMVGLAVDTCREFVRIPPESFQPPPEAISEFSKRYLQGFAILNQRPVLILDVGAILETPGPSPREQTAHGN